MTKTNPNPQTGAASIDIELQYGEITVRHGMDLTDILLARAVTHGTWERLWELLDKPESSVEPVLWPYGVDYRSTIDREAGAARIRVELRQSFIIVSSGDGHKLLERQVQDGAWDRLWSFLRTSGATIPNSLARS